MNWITEAALAIGAMIGFCMVALCICFWAVAIMLTSDLEHE